jgi:hypothetical protein
MFLPEPGGPIIKIDFIVWKGRTYEISLYLISIAFKTCCIISLQPITSSNPINSYKISSKLVCS